MDRNEFIGKLQMVYVGDKNASADIIAEYDRLTNIINELENFMKMQQELYRCILSPRPKNDSEYNTKYATQCGLAQLDVILDKLKELKEAKNE